MSIPKANPLDAVQQREALDPVRPERRSDELVGYRVDASKPLAPLDLRELWQHRELVYHLILRDLKVRYKQTFVGVAWAIIQPVMTMLVFSVFFGEIVRVPSNNIPYPIFSYAALVPWLYFSNAISQAADSLVMNGHLLKKIYFPRLIMPLSRILGGLVDFAIAFVVLLVMMALFGTYARPEALFLIPLLVLLIIIIALGTGLWLAALNVRYRDVRYIVPFLIQTWMFATPVVYSSNLIAEKARLAYSLNPMTSVIEGFRWALLNDQTFSPSMLIVSFLVALVILVSGLVFFQRVEGTFADTV